MRWIKLYEPTLVPAKYVEQVKGRNYSVKDFFEYQEMNSQNPCNLLFGYVDENNAVKGYLWANINALDSTLFINTLSVDKKLWHNKKVFQEAIEFLNKVQKKIEASKTLWCSTNKRFFLSKGFKTSKIWLMEYDPNHHLKDDTNEVKNGTN